MGEALFKKNNNLFLGRASLCVFVPLCLILLTIVINSTQRRKDAEAQREASPIKKAHLMIEGFACAWAKPYLKRIIISSWAELLFVSLASLCLIF